MKQTLEKPRSMGLRLAAVGLSAGLVGVYVYLVATGALGGKAADPSNGGAPGGAALTNAPAVPDRTAMLPGSKSAAHVMPSEGVLYGDGKSAIEWSKADAIYSAVPAGGGPGAGSATSPGVQPTVIDRGLLLSGSKSAPIIVPGTASGAQPTAPTPPATPSVASEDLRGLLLSGSNSASPLFTIPVKRETYGGPGPATAPAVPSTEVPRSLLLSGSKSMSGVVTITPGTLTLTPQASGAGKPATAPTTQPAKPVLFPLPLQKGEPMLLPGSKSSPVLVVPKIDQPPQQQAAPSGSKP